MKITFVRPNMNNERSFDAMEPLVFGVLAGLTPPGIDLALYDERIEEVPLDEPTDLVALTVETYTARRAYEIATSFRERGVPVVMGGYHPTFLPEEACLYADAVAVGDAETLWPEIVEDAFEGRLKPFYVAPAPPSLDGLVVDRSLFKEKSYSPIQPVQYGRGCRFACDFCSIHAFYGKHLRQRPIQEVIAEIEALEGRYIFLVDDNLFVDGAKAEVLFRALEPLRVRWACQISLDVANNQHLLDLMARAGCVTALIGFESLNAQNLTQMGKRWHLRQGAYTEAIRKFRARGIMLYGTFLFGYDHDTVDAFDRTVAFARQSRFCLANFNPLTPTPGTRLYDRLRKEGRLLYNRWWLDDGFRYGDALFHPKGMTAQELTDGCFRARRQFNTLASTLRRALDPRANCRNPRNLGLFLMANRVSRKEIYRKQGFRLGTRASLPTKPPPLDQDLYRKRYEDHAY